jgi:phospholipase C
MPPASEPACSGSISAGRRTSGRVMRMRAVNRRRFLQLAGGSVAASIMSDRLTAALPNPGTYDLRLHGPNGFFRHFAGSPATKLRVEANSDPESGRLRLRIAGGDDDHRDRRHRRPVVVEVADAYGRDRKVELHGVEEITVDPGHSGGWYDLALTKPSDPTFGYQLAGRLESARRLTSDPQLGRS